MLNIPSSSANSLAVSCQARFCLPKPRTPIPDRHGGVTLSPPDCSHQTAHQAGEPKLEKKSWECSSWSNRLPVTRYTKLKSSNAPSFGVTCFSASSGAAGCLLHTSVLIRGSFLPGCAESSRYMVCSFLHSSTKLSASYELHRTGTLTKKIPTSTHTQVYGRGWPKWLEIILYITTKPSAIFFCLLPPIQSRVLLLLFLFYNSLQSYCPLWSFFFPVCNKHWTWQRSV